MSFAARLLQAILALVVVTMAAVLYIAQRQNVAVYGELVDELLSQRTNAVQQEQEARHRLAAEQGAALAGSVRLFAALEAGDPEVYKIASDELRVGDFDVFRLFDAEGRMIEPPADGRAGALEAGSLEGHLVPQTLAPDGGAQLGFVAAARRPDGPIRPLRILAVPISSFGNPVGTLLLGERITALGRREADIPAAEGVHSTIWVGEALLGGDLQPPLAQALIRALNANPDDLNAELSADGQTYRYQGTLLNPGSAYPPARLVSVFSLAPLQAQQRELAWRIVGVGAIAFLAAALVALALSRQLARPVAELVTATRRIQAGDYAHRLGTFSTREMATLADSFNDMAAGLALKDRYHSVLQQVADPQIAEALISGRVKLGGELRDVTVMFCDIRQYTALTLGREPEEVIELLNQHLSAMAKVVQQHGGVINQFAGDAVMALFGAPASYGDDTERAVRCARAMVAERERLNVHVDVPLQVGIGIASGRMVAGCIGAENRSDYTVVGARVNLAARLSSTAGPAEILVDDLTRSRIGDVFPTEPLEPMSLKGFTEPVSAFRIRSSRPEAA